jgi:nucleotide-binding universal stress UspA family protein
MSILAAIDFSDNTDKVIQTAEKMATMMQGSLYLLHVAEPEPDFVGYDAGPETVREQVAKEFHQQHAALQDYAQALRDKNIDCTALLIQGMMVESILKEADKVNAEMIITGSHGHGAVYDILVGSVSAGVIKHSKIPVLVVPVIPKP